MRKRHWGGTGKQAVGKIKQPLRKNKNPCKERWYFESKHERISALPVVRQCNENESSPANVTDKISAVLSVVQAGEHSK